MSTDSTRDDYIEFNDSMPFSLEEKRKLRRIIREDEHATWLRKKLKVFLPWFIGIATALYGGWSWLLEIARNHPK